MKRSVLIQQASDAMVELDVLVKSISDKLGILEDAPETVRGKDVEVIKLYQLQKLVRVLKVVDGKLTKAITKPPVVFTKKSDKT